MDAQTEMMARLFKHSTRLVPGWWVEEVWFESPESGNEELHVRAAPPLPVPNVARAATSTTPTSAPDTTLTSDSSAPSCTAASTAPTAPSTPIQLNRPKEAPSLCIPPLLGYVCGAPRGDPTGRPRAAFLPCPAEGPGGVAGAGGVSAEDDR